jgi:cell division septum initiation protein DivIVA
VTDHDAMSEVDATPAGPTDTRALLERLQDIVENARAMPLSASAIVPRDEVSDLLHEALEGLPEELREARWLLKERDEVVERARREAERIIEAARVRAERMVERTEVVREARRSAEQIIEEAERHAGQLRNEAEDYVDRKLASFEVVLDRTIQAVQKGRERLQVQVGPPPGEEEDDLGAGGSAFFDQDE